MFYVEQVELFCPKLPKTSQSVPKRPFAARSGKDEPNIYQSVPIVPKVVQVTFGRLYVWVMNSTTEANGSGNWIAFVFGAVFNVLGNVELSFLLDYALQAVIGGIICLIFKVLGDILSPLWLKHKDQVSAFARKRMRMGKRKRHD